MGTQTNTLVHHNVFFRNNRKTEASKYKPLTNKAIVRIYNNTFLLAEQDSAWAYEFVNEYAVDTFWNNLGRETKNNLLVEAGDETKWKFADAENGDYRLTDGSPAIDAGEEVAGITDGYVGAAPDLGAYEYGADSWHAGHTWGTVLPWPTLSQIREGGTHSSSRPGRIRTTRLFTIGRFQGNLVCRGDGIRDVAVLYHERQASVSYCVSGG